MAWQGVIDRLDDLRAPRRSSAHGQVAEWLKAHAWNACIGETLSRVRIPLCPPLTGYAMPGNPAFFRLDPCCCAGWHEPWSAIPIRSSMRERHSTALSLMAFRAAAKHVAASRTVGRGPSGRRDPWTAAGDQLPVFGTGMREPHGPRFCAPGSTDRAFRSGDRRLAPGSKFRRWRIVLDGLRPSHTGKIKGA